MEDKFVKDFNLYCDNQIKLRNEIISLLDEIKDENGFTKMFINNLEASFWEDIVKSIGSNYSAFGNEEKIKRLCKIVCEYKTISDFCEEIDRISMYFRNKKNK